MWDGAHSTNLSPLSVIVDPPPMCIITTNHEEKVMLRAIHYSIYQLFNMPTSFYVERLYDSSMQVAIIVSYKKVNLPLHKYEISRQIYPIGDITSVDCNKGFDSQ